MSAPLLRCRLHPSCMSTLPSQKDRPSPKGFLPGAALRLAGLCCSHCIGRHVPVSKVIYALTSLFRGRHGSEISDAASDLQEVTFRGIVQCRGGCHLDC